MVVTKYAASPSFPSSSISSCSPERSAKMVQKYGEWFCGIIKPERIAQLPKVTAMQLGLKKCSKYFECRTTPEHLEKHSAVRFKIPGEHPNKHRYGIALRCTFTEKNRDGTETVVEYVEPIFQRYVNEKNVYVTSGTTRGTNGKLINSNLYNSGGMSDADVKRVRDLLKKRTVTCTKYQTLTEHVTLAPPRELTPAEKILLTFGNEFGNKICETVGTETLAKLPLLEAESLSVDLSDWKNPSINTTVAQLQGHSAVRFMNRAGNPDGPGMAIHVRRRDKTSRRAEEAVEVIYSFDGYPIRWWNKSGHMSFQNEHGLMEVDLKKVRDLLQGKVVTSSADSNVELEMVQLPKAAPIVPLARPRRQRGVTYNIAGSFPSSVYRSLRR